MPPDRVSNFFVFWEKHKRSFLRIALILLCVSAAFRLVIEFSRLLTDWELNAAIDLKTRHREIQNWFAGNIVYTGYNRLYPPPSYVLLWPLLGWPDLQTARIIWTVLTSLAVIAFIRQAMLNSNAENNHEKGIVALMFLAMNGTGSQIGHGQVTLLFFPLIIGALMLLDQKPGLRRDLLIAGAMLVSMVKPTISAPFCWIVVFRKGIRPLILAAICYVAAAIIGASFQPEDFFTLFDKWLSGTHQAVKGYEYGYGNVQSWLSHHGLKSLTNIVPVLLLLSMGVWFYLNRDIDLWIQIGIAGLYSRMWAYHLIYDDMLIILPMIALFRLLKNKYTSDRHQMIAGLLIAAASFLSLARLIHIAPWRFTLITTANQIVWMAMLCFLLFIAHTRQKDAAVSDSTA